VVAAEEYELLKIESNDVVRFWTSISGQDKNYKSKPFFSHYVYHYVYRLQWRDVFLRRLV